MYISKRPRLGSSITYSPAQKMRYWSINNMTAILYSALLVLAWLGLVYFGCVFYVWFGTHLSEWWEEGEILASEVYYYKTTSYIKLFGAIGIVFFTFRNTRRGDRRRRSNK